MCGHKCRCRRAHRRHDSAATRLVPRRAPRSCTPTRSAASRRSIRPRMSCSRLRACLRQRQQRRRCGPRSLCHSLEQLVWTLIKRIPCGAFRSCTKVVGGLPPLNRSLRCACTSRRAGCLRHACGTCAWPSTQRLHWCLVRFGAAGFEPWRGAVNAAGIELAEERAAKLMMGRNMQLALHLAGSEPTTS